jgi:hypothetical protein
MCDRKNSKLVGSVTKGWRLLFEDLVWMMGHAVCVDYELISALHKVIGPGWHVAHLGNVR